MSNKQKKKRLRDSFITIRLPDENGNGCKDTQVYAGDHMLPAGGWGKRRIALITFTAAEIICATVGSLGIFSVNAFFWVITFKLLAACGIAWQLLGTAELIFTKDKIKEIDFPLISRAFKYGALISCAMLFACLILQIIKLIKYSLSDSIACAALNLTAAGLAAASCAVFRAIRFVKEENKVKQGLKEINDKKTGMGTGVYVPRHPGKQAFNGKA